MKKRIPRKDQGQPSQQYQALHSPAKIKKLRDRMHRERLKKLVLIMAVYQDKAGEDRWRIKHRNGNLLACNGEGLSSLSGARRALRGFLRQVKQFHHMTWGVHPDMPVWVILSSHKTGDKAVIEWWTEKD